MSESPILESLAVEQRLAMAYAPASARPVLLATLGLDRRLAQVVLGAREPLLGQVRLAWWRERLGDPGSIPRGEPLLALIGGSHISRQPLVELVDGWERLLDDRTETAEAAVNALAMARGQAFAAVDPAAADAIVAGREWALADLARLAGSVGEAAGRIAGAQPWRRPKLPRSLRPLAVLHALARSRRGDFARQPGPSAVFVALKVGLFGA